MSSSPATDRGLAPVGRRVVAQVVDQLPYLLGYLLFFVVLAAAASGGAGAGALVVALLVYPLACIAYGIFTWWWLATRGLSPGKRAMSIRVVSARDGRPIGWGRAFVRGLVLGVVVGFTAGIGAVVLLVLAARDPRRQGWHDKAAESVVIDDRQQPPSPVRPVASVAQRPPAVVPVGVPQQVRSTLPAPLPVEPVQEAPRSPVAAAPPTVTAPPVAPAARPAPVAAPGLISDVPGLVTEPDRGSSAPPAPVEAFDEDDVEHTRMRPPRPAASAPWQLLVEAGRTVAVSGTGLLGRDPQPKAGEQVDLLVPVADPSLSVSKTHLQFGTDADGLWVVDRGSTNGTSVVHSDGLEEPCLPGVRMHVPAGGSLLAGDHRIEVQRT